MCVDLVHYTIEVRQRGAFIKSQQILTMADTTKVFLTLFLIVETLTGLPRIYARPGIYELPLTTDKPSGCYFSDTVDTLCQQCAKHTKSNIVYPLCCSNEDDAQAFCRAFLDFGL